MVADARTVQRLREPPSRQAGGSDRKHKQVSAAPQFGFLSRTDRTPRVKIGIYFGGGFLFQLDANFFIVEGNLYFNFLTNVAQIAVAAG